MAVIAGEVIVGECAGRLGSARQRRVESLGESEVQHLHGAVGSDLDVGGLQVAMDDAQVVRGCQRVGDLGAMARASAAAAARARCASDRRRPRPVP